MNRLKTVLSAAIAGAVLVGDIAFATAAPMVAPAPVVTAPSDVTPVQMRRRGDMDRRVVVVRRGGNVYMNGHRGYRQWRRGYRQRDGFWFPPAAFIAGAIIGGAIASPRAGYGSNHVQWCYDRWRSYDARTNTYQPSYGPRRVCVSPYS